MIVLLLIVTKRYGIVFKVRNTPKTLRGKVHVFACNFINVLYPWESIRWIIMIINTNVDKIFNLIACFFIKRNEQSKLAWLVFYIYITNMCRFLNLCIYCVYSWFEFIPSWTIPTPVTLSKHCLRPRRRRVVKPCGHDWQACEPLWAVYVLIGHFLQRWFRVVRGSLNLPAGHMAQLSWSVFLYFT